MKKSSILIALVFTATALFFTNNVKAQTAPVNPWRFGIGVEAGVPTGNANITSTFELGGTARLQYDAGKDFAWTLTSGYYNFFGKDNVATPAGPVNYSSFGVVPVKLGIKAFFAPKLYFGAEAGAGFETNSGGTTKLILSPALGFANKTWDVSARYENFSSIGDNYGLVGLRLAYAFGM